MIKYCLNKYYMKFVSIAPDGAVIFDSMVSEKPAFVKFYHPDCGHCRSMAPEWAALKDELEGETFDANVIEVHADAIPNIKSACARDIEGLPTLMMVGKGGETIAAHEGERTRERLAAFMKKNIPKSGGKKTRRKRKTRGLRIRKKRTRKRTRKHVRKRSRNRRSTRK
jgi:thiol-disulfide isomerase/thioredoxin